MIYFYSNPLPQSRVGCTSPFPLASLEGVKALRADILQKRVLDNHMMQSGIAGPHAQLRGMAPEAAQFVQQFWTNPATLAAVSEAAGEDLVPVFDLEVGVQRECCLCYDIYSDKIFFFI
jgi:hypothetical protein